MEQNVAIGREQRCLATGGLRHDQPVEGIAGPCLVYRCAHDRSERSLAGFEVDFAAKDVKERGGVAVDATDLVQVRKFQFNDGRDQQPFCGIDGMTAGWRQAPGPILVEPDEDVGVEVERRWIRRRHSTHGSGCQASSHERFAKSSGLPLTVPG